MPKTIEEITQEYPNEWLAVEVTIWDDNEGPLEGVLLDHDTDPGALEDRVPVSTDRMIAVFFNGPAVPDGWAVIL